MLYHYSLFNYYNKLKNKDWFLVVLSYVISILLYLLLSSLVLFMLSVSGYALVDYKGKATGEELDRAAGVVPGIAKTNRFLVPDANTNIAGINTLTIFKLNFVSTNNTTNTIDYSSLSNIYKQIINYYISSNSTSNFIFFTNNTLFYCVTNRYYSDFDTYVSNSIINLNIATNYIMQEISNLFNNLNILSNYSQAQFDNIISNITVINDNIDIINYNIYEINLSLDNLLGRFNMLENYTYFNIPILESNINYLATKKADTNTIMAADGTIYRIINYPTNDMVLVFNPSNQTAYFSNYNSMVFGITSNDAYRGDWGDILSNRVVALETGIVNISFGITSNVAYRGDWGDSISNQVLDISTNLIAIQAGTNINIRDVGTNIYIDCIITNISGVISNINFGITSNDAYRGDWGNSVSNQVLEISTNLLAFHSGTSVNIRADGTNIYFDCIIGIDSNSVYRGDWGSLLSNRVNTLTTGKLDITGGVMSGALTNTYGIYFATNDISLWGGVLNGTNGVYFQRGTNRYWILLE